MVNSGGNDILAEREVRFSGALRGYDRREVDAYIRRLRARAGHLASELEEKERRLSEMGGDLSVPLQVIGSGNIGARVERIIAQAELEAREIRDQAERDAAETRKAYEDQAEQARRRREEVARRAEEQVRAMIRAAEEEVERLRGTRQEVLDQLRRIGEIIGNATDEATAIPAVEVRIEEILGVSAESDVDEDAIGSEVDDEAAESQDSEESTADDDAPAAAATAPEPEAAESEPEAAESETAESETAEDADAAAVAEQDGDPEAPVVAEPRKPAETGKISPAVLAAKARRRAQREQAAAAEA
ncbi:DivIVA domain-containing protein [Amycolatopsis viridis]|uniref:DivIVA domain-containing protein n=1 Tax=Amycolatopsis viridis TaxID=185678 RepID=A0ABX0T0L3_9PSEU|nr:DivIVA domain-containing protein [Amycolatopsis viridis]NIH81385.1 DivIVA domain-containing protein [Amycolatopsis viridis]